MIPIPMVRSNANISYKIHFFLGKNFGGTRHPCEKNEPTLDHSVGGGMHGKACWLIAYVVLKKISVIAQVTINVEKRKYADA